MVVVFCVFALRLAAHRARTLHFASTPRRALLALRFVRASLATCSLALLYCCVSIPCFFTHFAAISEDTALCSVQFLRQFSKDASMTRSSSAAMKDASMPAQSFRDVFWRAILYSLPCYDTPSAFLLYLCLLQLPNTFSFHSSLRPLV